MATGLRLQDNMCDNRKRPLFAGTRHNNLIAQKEGKGVKTESKHCSTLCLHLAALYCLQLKDVKLELLSAPYSDTTVYDTGGNCNLGFRMNKNSKWWIVNIFI